MLYFFGDRNSKILSNLLSWLIFIVLWVQLQGWCFWICLQMVAYSLVKLLLFLWLVLQVLVMFKDCVVIIECHEFIIAKRLVIHSSVTNISKNLHFVFVRLMMYIVFIIDHIHHLMNESKILTFAYISDRRVYFLNFILSWFNNKKQSSK